MKRIILLLFIAFLGFQANSQELDIVGDGGNTFALRNSTGSSSTLWQSFYPDHSASYKAFLQSHQDGNFDVAAREDLKFFANFLNYMTLKSAGNLGLGTSSPDGKMEISYNSGIANPTLRLTESSTTDGSRLTFGNSNPSYFTLYGNPSATAADGVFNLYHSTAGNVMSWKGDGSVGVGNTSPDYKMQLVGSKGSATSGTGGVFGLGATSSTHMGFTVNTIDVWSSTPGTGSDLYLNYYSNKTVHIGNGAAGSNLDINGFTNLGDGAPKIKMKKLTGTSAASQGSTVNIPHGLGAGSADKILAVNIAIEYGTNSWANENYTAGTIEFESYYNDTNIVVRNVSGGSAGIISKPIKILVTYEE